MYPIFEHTLKKPSGRWDKQSLTFFLFMNLTVIMGIGNTIASYAFGITDNKMAYEVFTTFAFITMGMSGTTIINKFVDYTKAKNPQQDPYANNGFIETQINNNIDKNNP
jgi:hypothetical protein